MSAPVLESRRPSVVRLAGFALLLTAVSLGLCVFSAFPWTGSDPDAAVVRIAFKHVAAFEHAGPSRSQEEIDKLPRHMRPTSPELAQTGRRVDTQLTVAVNGRVLLGQAALVERVRVDLRVALAFAEGQKVLGRDSHAGASHAAPSTGTRAKSNARAVSER